MLFHSQAFVLLFLPATVALYYAMARSCVQREWALIAASLVFYGWWDARFLPLLLGHILITWTLARLYASTGRRGLLTLAIVLNFVSLGFFKYADFLTDAVATASGLALPRHDILLPIGISFFTFQCVSYLIDLLRGDAPQYPLRRLTLFVVLFPHLIAGPIVRHNEIIPQFDNDPLRDGLEQRLSRGITLFVIGLLLKVFIADGLARNVDGVFKPAGAAGAAPTFSDAWSAAIGFALQIYFDFSAYSEMAIGIALMLGLHFPMNFDMPYRATSLREFWRRWHMSLSRFLRDYLYIPLGGSRHGFMRFVAASLMTMGLCGLWHGAGWTFVIWGLLHGVGLIVVRTWDRAGLPMPAWLGWGLTMLFVVAAFMVFRAPDLATVGHMAMGMSGGGGLGRLQIGTLAMLLGAGGLAMLPWPNPEAVDRLLKPTPSMAVVTALAATYVMIEVGRGAPTSFIYFQF